jgi:two-component system phosphate regulon sensor histidine kinase PhoR
MFAKTPRAIAFWLSILIFATCLVAFFIIWGYGVAYSTAISIHILWAVPLVIALVSYYFIFLFIERFLYSRIKIIYKSIHSFKSQSEKKPSIVMSDDVLKQIDDEVAQWAELRIREIKSLQETDTFRREFIGNLAHELKTPLFSIQGFIETVADDPDMSQMQRDQFLSKAQRQVGRLAGLISDLDSISKLESEEALINMEKFDLVECVDKAIEGCEKLARQKEISMFIKDGSPKHLWVKGDEMKISQVLTNLLSNAIHYGNQFGEIKLRFYDMNEHVLCEIADNGIGIEKEHLPRIFERFYRVDQSRSRNEGGSGLGLAICKHIMESHKESISVRSTIGIGTTFSFTLKKA